MARVTQNAVRNADGTIFGINASADTVVAFLRGFNAIPQKKRSGYDKYYNDNGPTNPESPRALSPQGIGKMLAVFLEKAHETIARGGADGEEMKIILAGIVGYNDIAASEAVKNMTAQAATVVSPEKVAAFLAGKGVDIVPTASVTEAEEAEAEEAEAEEAEAEEAEAEEAEAEEAEAIADETEEAEPAEPVAYEGVVTIK